MNITQEETIGPGAREGDLYPAPHAATAVYSSSQTKWHQLGTYIRERHLHKILLSQWSRRRCYTNILTSLISFIKL